MIGLGVREIRMFELVYPKGGTKVLKEKVKMIQKRHPWVSIAFGPSKRDKFVDGVEFL